MNHYSHRSSASAISAISNQIATVKALSLDGILQQLHLVVRYKKGIYNRVVDMFSIPAVNVTILLKSNYVLPKSYVEQYAQDVNFQEVYLNFSQGHQVEDLEYHVHDNFLYHLGKLCVP